MKLRSVAEHKAAVTEGPTLTIVFPDGKRPKEMVQWVEYKRLLSAFDNFTMRYQREGYGKEVT